MDEVRVRAPVFEGVLRKRLVDFRPAVSRVLVATIAMQSQRPDSQRPEVNPFHAELSRPPARHACEQTGRNGGEKQNRNGDSDKHRIHGFTTAHTRHTHAVNRIHRVRRRKSRVMPNGVTRHSTPLLSTNIQVVTIFAPRPLSPVACRGSGIATGANREHRPDTPRQSIGPLDLDSSPRKKADASQPRQYLETPSLSNRPIASCLVFH